MVRKSDEVSDEVDMEDWSNFLEGIEGGRGLSGGQ